MDSSQTAAAQAEEQRVIVEAGPGSGKTRTLVARVLWLLERGYTGSEVLVITFTRAAAREARARILAGLTTPTLKARARGLSVSTFHALALHLLREPGLPMRVLDQEGADELLVYAALQCGVIDGETAVRYLANGLADRTRGRLMREAEGQLEALHAQTGSIDYRKLERALLDRADEWAGRAEWLHVIVDEGQDTTTEQQDALHRLAGDRGSLWVAMDPEQTLYRWRGACPETWDACVRVGGWTRYRLITNYRSDPGIVAEAERLVPRGLVAVEGREDAETPVGMTTPHEWEPGMAVLGRTWADVERCADLLRDAGAPVHVERPAQSAWHRQASARYLFAFVRAWRDPDDEVALWRLCCTGPKPMRPAEWNEALGLAAEGQADTLLDAALAVGGHFRRVLLLAREDRPFLGLAEEVPWLIGPMEKLIDLSAVHGRDPQEVIDLLCAGEVQELAEAPEGAVVCTTVHQAKGREWDRVTILPRVTGSELYVAVTRARHAVRYTEETA